MLAEIITIGDEILIGQIVDTNSTYISKALNKIGIDVYQITSIQDEKKHILQALEEAKNRVDVVLITGGLGPTKDDITKHTLCEYFDDKLEQDDEVLAHVEELFEKYLNKPLSPINKQQALVPTKAIVLKNQFGTAPGMWLEKDNTVFISMPGVPFEMKELIDREVIPRLQRQFKTPFILHKTLMTYGVGESDLANAIAEVEDNLPPSIKLAYLPNLGKVRLRLSARGEDKEVLEKALGEEVAKIEAILGDVVVGYEEDKAIELIVGGLLKANQKTLAIAESCTGGKIAETITANAGVSSFFNGGVVTYATRSKVDVLGIDNTTIETFGVTSHEVAQAMAKAAQHKFKADYAIATTGNAGPSKGDGDVEVGTVYIGIATPTRVFSEKFKFSNHRTRTIGKAVSKSFELLKKTLETS